MSSRVLKKLHGDTDLKIHEHDEDDELQSDIENDIGNVAAGSGAKKKQLNINRYDLVNYIICWHVLNEGRRRRMFMYYCFVVFFLFE